MLNRVPVFRSARLKLTVWYVAILMVISLMFSGSIYTLSVREVQHFEQLQRWELQEQLQTSGCLSYDARTCGFGPTLAPGSTLLNDSKRRILSSLAVVNLTILLAATVFSYLLAGKTLKPIQNMVDDQNRFISDASHELRTPLTSLKSGFELFLRDAHHSLRDAVTLAKEGLEDVQTLQSLTESMLQLTQYQSTPRQATLSPLKLIEPIQDASRRVKKQASHKKITVTIEVESSWQVIGNKQSLSDLFVILLDNAIKYSPSRTTVHVRAKQLHRSVAVSVVDQGIGIEPTDLGHIFDRFYRADTARTKTTDSGYGLGLSIAQNIVALHKGCIDVTSVVGQGSVFTVHLPLTRT